MQKKIILQCSDCKKTFPYQFLLHCPYCNGIIDPQYDLSKFTLHDASSPLERYFSLVPFQDTKSIVNLGEGNTPCVHAKTLGKELGLEKLYLKDETGQITGSTKDRMAACVISQFKELGIKEFVVSSTGNTATAYAYAVAQQGDMRLHLFCGRDFVHKHTYPDNPRIQMHLVDGDYVEAAKAAKKFAKEHNLLLEGSFFNLARREGAKLAYLEVFDQMPEEPSVVLQAVSSGIGIYGAFQGATEYLALGRLHHMPRFVCVQQDTCQPMVKAYEAKSPVIREEDIVKDPHGLAEAILLGDPTQPYPYMYKIVMKSKGCFIAVSQDAMRQMQTLLKKTEHIDACYDAVASLCAAQELRKSGWIRPEEVVLVNLTGGMKRSL